jgi:hypothetical protein
MTGKAIYALLTASTDVTDLVGTRIFPDMATQKAAYPFVVYSVEATEPSDTKDGVSGLDIVEVAIMSYANSYEAVNLIAAVVRSTLDRATGAYAGVNVQSIRFTDQRSSRMDWDKHIYIIEQAYSVRIER